MKILLITHRVPYPPNKGDRIVSFNILKYLSKKHEISLVYPSFSRRELKFVNDLKKYCVSVDSVLLSPWISKIRCLFSFFNSNPFSLNYFYSRKMGKIIKQKIKEADLIFVYSSSMAQYVIDVKKPKVMDFVDVDSDKWLQYSKIKIFPLSLLYRLEYKRLRNFEIKITKDGNATLKELLK